MKKVLFSLGLLAAGAWLITGCTKDDTTAPVITLVGNSSITYSLPATAGGAAAFSDPGYTASDDKDGNITTQVSVSGTVNLNRKGTYTLVYTVSDKAGNSASETRTVTVVNDAEAFAGTYNNCVDSCQLSGNSAFVATVTVSDTVNNLVSISNFGAFNVPCTPPAAGCWSWETKIYLTFSGTSAGSGMTMSIGTSQSLGGNAFVSQFYPTGSAVLTASPNTSFKVKYQWNDGTSTDVCNSYYVR